MALWEYKVITSGKGGFATPALLEKFLNDLGRDEWEIVCFHTAPDNFLAFTGLARRTTQRDWTLEDAAAAAAKAEAEKLRAEFEAKFKAASQPAPSTEERAPSFLEEKLAGDDGFRKPVDTSHDAEPEDEEEAKADQWDDLGSEEELPTFFDAMRPHMRRNQRGPGMSVGVDYLAKKWDQSEDDIKGALVECGFVVPTDEDAAAEYVEYDGDLYWVNVNRRGELWINTKEKPRPVFRPVKAQKVVLEDPAPKPRPEPEPKPEGEERKPEAGEQPAAEGAEAAPAAAGGGEAHPHPQGQGNHQQKQKQQGGGAPLPQGPALLDKIRPHMRRNRRGPGGSGSTSFLARALRTNEGELKAAFAALGLTIPSSAADKPVYTEIGKEVWWMNVDSRGGLWINGREKKDGEVVGAKDETAGEAPQEAAPGSAAPDAVPAPEVAPSASEVAREIAPQPAEVSATTTAAPASGDTQSAPVSEAPAAQAAPSDTPAQPAPNPASGGDAAAAAPSEPAAPAGGLPPESERAPRPADVAPQPEAGNVLSSVRLHLKETKTGSIAGKVERVAEELNKSPDDLVAALVGAGLKVPEKPREKPVFVEHAGEILWLNKNAKGELWLNAKASKFADKDTDEEPGAENEASDAGESADSDPEKKARRPRPRKKSESGTE